MANQYHLSVLREGSNSWNQWRGQSPEIRPDLTGAVLNGIDLSGANLSEVNLAQAILSKAHLQDVLFWQANLRGCDLSGADLRQANFYHADLRQTNLSESHLEQANFRETLLGGTYFVNIDLSAVKELETAWHEGRSYLDIHTLYRSHGQIPEDFLRGIGAPEHFLLSINLLLKTPIHDLSCFISSSQHDAAFVSRLYSDLQRKRVRCWSVFHDLNNEQNDIKNIKEMIQMHDIWLIVLSQYTLVSEWVKQEIYMTMNMEKQQNRTILFPLCVHQDFLDLTPNSTLTLLQNRQIRNFINWQDTASYQQGFTELLRDLKKGGNY